MQSDPQPPVFAADSVTAPPTARAAGATREIALAAGESLRLRVSAGTVLHMRDGHAVLAGPPQWLAENLYWPGRRLAPGSVFVIVAGGWVTISACGAAGIRVTPPATGSLRLPDWRAAWHKMLAFLSPPIATKTRPARERL